MDPYRNTILPRFAQKQRSQKVSLLPMQKIGCYQIEEQLGSGGMANGSLRERMENDRYPTAGAFVQDVQELVSGRWDL